MADAGLMVKFNGSPELVDELARLVDENPGDMTLKSSGPADDASGLKLGLAEVSTIIAIINGTVTLGKFAYSVYQHLHKNKDERLTVQTPLKTVEIEGSDATSEDNIRTLLESGFAI